MVDKDKVYDPDIGLEYCGEREHVAFVVNDCNYDHDSDDELNNRNCKTISSSARPVVTTVHNDTGDSPSELARIGGPLMDPSGRQEQPQLLVCINLNCQRINRLTPQWYEASEFLCHNTYADDEEELALHNQLCQECATNEAICSECPRHGEGRNPFGDPPEVVREV